MTQRTSVRLRSVVDQAPSVEPSRSDQPSPPNNQFMALLESASQESLTVTHWLDTASYPGSNPLTIRFAGQRVGVQGPLRYGDQFVQDEIIEDGVPGSGPLSISVHVRDITPGEWIVTARVLESHRATRRRREPGNVPPASVPPDAMRLITRLWHAWGASTESPKPVRTCQFPFARVPGIIPGIWPALVSAGIVVALVIQALVIAHLHLAVHSGWVVSLVAILAGIIGAKWWFITKHRHEHRWEGWCIQGFIVGATLAAAIMLVALGIPAGAFLDPIAPGLMFGMAVGRLGCFFGGCCGGPMTASRWGVWSSDQRVGAHRIPTQLMESVLALMLGVGGLIAIWGHGQAGGAYFVAALAAYTLGRQGILRLRAERHTSPWDGLVTAFMALVLVASIAFLAWKMA